MRLRELIGKKANINRWEALKQLDWEKDAEMIEWICNVENPRFFTSRTPEQAIEYGKQDMENMKKFEEMCAEHKRKQARA